MDYTCPTCYGTGNITDFNAIINTGEIHFVPCPMCGGSGILKDEEDD